MMIDYGERLTGQRIRCVALAYRSILKDVKEGTPLRPCQTANKEVQK